MDEPEWSVYHLLAHSLDLPWEDGFRQVQNLGEGRTLNESESKLYQQLLQRRVANEPLQYILGKWDFLDYTFRIRAPLLCPRPETEELVLKVRDDVLGADQDTRILDIGCGTGAIGVSLADLLPSAIVEAIDIEPIAVETSTENAKIVLGDAALSRYKPKLCSAADFSPTQRFDIVVSNPPYIPRADMDTLSKTVVEFESPSALCGGEDGLDVVRDIIERLPKWCNAGASCWMEVDPTHPEMIQSLLDSNSNIDFDSGHKDLYGLDRFVKLVVTKTE